MSYFSVTSFVPRYLKNPSFDDIFRFIAKIVKEYKLFYFHSHVNKYRVSSLLYFNFIIMLGRTQPTTRTSATDRDSSYDEIRYSQLLRNSNICAEVGASSPGYSSKSQYLLSVIYDNYDDDNEDYSRLLLKQNQSTCIPKRKNILEDEGYAFLRTSDIKELKSDILIQKHRSLPTFATIHNQISSTDFKPLSRCLSENYIMRSTRFHRVYLKPIKTSNII